MIAPFRFPEPCEMAIALLDVCGNDLQKAIELAELSLDHKAEDFEFRVAVVQVLLTDGSAQA